MGQQWFCCVLENGGNSGETRAAIVLIIAFVVMNEEMKVNLKWASIFPEEITDILFWK